MLQGPAVLSACHAVGRAAAAAVLQSFNNPGNCASEILGVHMPADVTPAGEHQGRAHS
jgi:hypothetical protein